MAIPHGVLTQLRTKPPMDEPVDDLRRILGLLMALSRTYSHLQKLFEYLMGDAEAANTPIAS